MAQSVVQSPHSRKVLGSIGRWGACSFLHVTSVHTQGGVGERVFLCVEFSWSPRVPQARLKKEKQSLLLDTSVMQHLL